MYEPLVLFNSFGITERVWYELGLVSSSFIAHEHLFFI